MYSMSSNSYAEKSAIKAVIKYLEFLPETSEIVSVENDPKFRKIDVDLIWTKVDGMQFYVEVKGDTYTTGNFAFETMSNKEENKPGCFLYTEADFVFYYFTKWKKLYILPMPKTREWFKNKLGKYRTVTTKTCGNNNNIHLYTTVCKLVPIKDVLAEFPEIQEIQL